MPWAQHGSRYVSHIVGAQDPDPGPPEETVAWSPHCPSLSVEGPGVTTTHPGSSLSGPRHTGPTPSLVPQALSQWGLPHAPGSQ